MKLAKSPPELVLQIARAVEGIDCEKRVMFGFPAYFINKNLYAGLFENKLFLRLSPGQISALKAAREPVVNLEPMPGRPMKDYWVLPPSVVAHAKRLHTIAAEAADFTRGLPPKVKKPARKAPLKRGSSE